MKRVLNATWLPTHGEYEDTPAWHIDKKGHLLRKIVYKVFTDEWKLKSNTGIPSSVDGNQGETVLACCSQNADA